MASSNLTAAIHPNTTDMGFTNDMDEYSILGYAVYFACFKPRNIIKQEWIEVFMKLVSKRGCQSNRSTAHELRRRSVIRHRRHPRQRAQQRSSDAMEGTRLRSVWRRCYAFVTQLTWRFPPRTYGAMRLGHASEPLLWRARAGLRATH